MSRRSCQITKKMRLTVRKFKVYQTSGVPLHRDQSPPLTGLISVLTGCGSNFNLQTFSRSLSLYSVQCFLYPDCRSSLSSLSLFTSIFWRSSCVTGSPLSSCPSNTLHTAIHPCTHTHTQRDVCVLSTVLSRCSYRFELRFNNELEKSIRWTWTWSLWFSRLMYKMWESGQSQV